MDNKEYSFKEVIDYIKPGEKYECSSCSINCLENESLEITSPTGYIIIFLETNVFTKVEPKTPVSTSEAFKAYEEGKVIESVVSGDKYLKGEHNEMLIARKLRTGFACCKMLNTEELSGKWYILDKEGEN